MDFTTAEKENVMKTGKTLTELATEIERQQKTKTDYIATVPALRIDEHANIAFPDPTSKTGNLNVLGINELAHRQIGEFAGIPAKYYDRMRTDAPELLAKNVNHWFANSVAGEKRMLRTLDGRVRAFLSDRYRPLENVDLAEAVLPALSQLQVKILSCEITERRLYIKAVDERIEKDVPTGRKMGDGSHVIFDTLCPAISISNSEVGSGALSVEVGVYTRACTNLAFFAERSLRKYHVGGRHELAEGLTTLLSEKTRRLTDAATWSQVGDVVLGAFDKARFEASLEKISGMTENRIVGDPVKVVEIAARRFGTTDTERASILRHLVEGGDLTQYGLFNAFTRTAEDLPDYDRATDFERIGGQIIDLPANDWKELTKAA